MRSKGLPRVSIGRLGERHDRNWNRKWWKRMCLGLDILNTRHLWNGHRELHSKLWSRRSRAVRGLRAWGAEIPRTQNHWLKVHSAALRFILSHSPCMICAFSKENWHDQILMKLDQAIAHFYYKKFVLKLLMRQNYALALQRVVTLALGWCASDRSGWVDVLHCRVWAYRNW